jgi:hypothetical protein
MSLATYAEARPWAKAIKEELLEKRMPPWNAVKGYGEFSNAPVLTQRDIELIINWVEGGAPPGEDKELPEGPLYSTDWPLGAPDLVLSADDTKVAADGDEYRDFVLDTKLKQDRWLSAVDVKPGNGSVFHCATIGVQTGSSAAAGRTLATWAPGQRLLTLPSPFAESLPAGAKIVMRVHYHGNGDAASDRSQVGLYFSKAAGPKSVQEIAITDPSVTIPPGKPRQKVSASIVVQSDLDAIAVRPRVNALIVSMQATAYRPDGTEEVLIWTRGYQFDWQRTYYLKRPVALPKGTRVEVIAYFDNSDQNRHNPNDPPKPVRWSDSPTDPLFSLLAVSHDSTE